MNKRSIAEIAGQKALIWRKKKINELLEQTGERPENKKDIENWLIKRTEIRILSVLQLQEIFKRGLR